MRCSTIPLKIPWRETSSGKNFTEVAKTAWERAKSDFYHPPIPEPIIETDETASSFFYIDAETWTVHLNLTGVPLHLDSTEAESFLRSICHHEIQHYLVCPFDGVTNGLMFSGARRHLSDSLAMFTCNLFADLVVDSHLLRRYPSLTHNRVKASIFDASIRTREHSDIWRLVVATYRKMWGYPIPTGIQIDETTFSAAQEIVEVARKYINREQKWPLAVRKIAKIIDDWLEDHEDFSSCMPSSDGGQDGTDSDSTMVVNIPLDVDTVMGDPLQERNGDVAKRCLEHDQVKDAEQELERLAIEVEERGGDLEDLESVFMLYGAGTERGEWTRFWYRAKAQNLLKFSVKHMRHHGATPLSPNVWRLGDPIEELDVVQSLQAFPVLVPNMSTRRWLKTEIIGLEESKTLPDLLLVLDSSGSMSWSRKGRNLSGSFHLALVSAFAALDYVIKKGCRVAAINFSVDLTQCEWTKDRMELEHTLLAYEGGGTVIPINQISELCTSATDRVMVLVISDAQISNWHPFVKRMKDLTSRGHELFLFHIGSRSKTPSKRIADLVKSGVEVIPVSSVKDLPDLVIGEVHRKYENAE